MNVLRYQWILVQLSPNLYNLLLLEKFHKFQFVKFGKVIDIVKCDYIFDPYQMLESLFFYLLAIVSTRYLKEIKEPFK